MTATAQKDNRNQLGQFITGNPGKPKGALTKQTKQAREILTDFLIDKASDLDTIYDELDAKDKAALLLHIGRLVIPRPEKTADDESPLRIVVRTIDTSPEN